MEYRCTNCNAIVEGEICLECGHPRVDTEVYQQSVIGEQMDQNVPFADNMESEQAQQAPKRKRRPAIGGILIVVLLVVLTVFIVVVIRGGEALWPGFSEPGKKAGHKHDWVPATCTEAKYCSECGKIRGSELGHTWTAVSCTEAQKCTVCGEIGEPATGHQWAEATEFLPQCCANCGKFVGRSLGRPLVNYSICDHSEKDGLEDNDIQVSSFTDFSGNLYEDALLFWVSTELECSYEYIVYLLPDVENEGLGIQIEYEAALTQENCPWDQLVTYSHDDFSAYVDVFLDGDRIGGTGKITGMETKMGTLDVPGGGEIKIYCNTTDKPWTDCIFKATVYYSALPEPTSD